MNYKWNYEAPDPATAAAEEELGRQVGIHPALANCSSIAAYAPRRRHATFSGRSSPNCTTHL